jgi:hypothetical protein
MKQKNNKNTGDFNNDKTTVNTQKLSATGQEEKRVNF